MTALAALLLAAALLTWPRGSAHRLASLRPRPPRQLRGTRFWLVLPATAATLLAGIGGLFAAGALTLTLHRWHRRGQQVRTRLRTTTAQADALHLVVAQLRTGADPATAATAVAADAAPAIARELTALATAARLGADPVAARPDSGPGASSRWKVPAGTGFVLERDGTGRGADPVCTPGRAAASPDAVSGRLLRAWRIAREHGVPLAELLDAQRRDLEQRARFASQVHARLAGPRATAAVLAVLPLVALGLGEVMRAAPLHVLTSTAAGQVLLVAGVVLVCAGLEWSARLAGRVGAA
ncbi:tight adherence protein B [Crossiella equi]|uniref:Tight adherence protein B n=1 Tax=Crossiella equi TaxID=130796 RepID=A0ABS5AHU7_9PSEU|nr:type II secretion system F family protein [Crossiella equi]MBP2475255.1 tight adherence protein B [Crossiella equi]